jgi:ferrous iron transport protein B
MIRIAIAGNPNSGKTTMFNSLSGLRERVGNWAGVTVEKKEAHLRKRYNFSNEEVILVDLPGAYSMDAYTKDEMEATTFLKREKIDSIVNVVDSSNLERSLKFSLQLIETKIPVVIALNKSDIIHAMKTTIDINQLSKLLNTKVCFTQATIGSGLFELMRTAIELAIKG